MHRARGVATIPPIEIYSGLPPIEIQTRIPPVKIHKKRGAAKPPVEIFNPINPP
jgi:hypothetical protein